MNTRKWMLPLGMLAVISFLALTTFGRLLWPGYNPIHSYVSELFADGAPHVRLMKTFMDLYTICFCVFALAMAVHACREYHICGRIGYIMLFIIAYSSVLGYGAVPISMVDVISANDLFHLVFTIAVLSVTIIAVILISIRYLKDARSKTMGKISLILGVIYTLCNLWHVVAVLSGQNILGLIQRLTFYSFHMLTFMISWICTFRLAGNTAKA